MLIESQIEREWRSRFTTVEDAWADWEDAWDEETDRHLQDELMEQQRAASEEFHARRNARNGERVRLLVPHPFNGETWMIYDAMPEPGFYRLVCRFEVYSQWTWFEGVFHCDEFESV